MANEYMNQAILSIPFLLAIIAIDANIIIVVLLVQIVEAVTALLAA